jgi:hypothetical protein
LKAGCSLTYGNLNRRLKVLDEAGAVRIHKAFVDSTPRTTVYLSKEGLERFSEYLSVLGEVLRKAKQALPGTSRKIAVFLAKTIKA